MKRIHALWFSVTCRMNVPKSIKDMCKTVCTQLWCDQAQKDGNATYYMVRSVETRYYMVPGLCTSAVGVQSATTCAFYVHSVNLKFFFLWRSVT